MSIRVPFFFSLFAAVCCSALLGQTASNSPPLVTNPQAVTLANQAMLAMTGGVPVTDVTISASATSPDGDATKSGTLTLKALGWSSSSLSISWSDGSSYSQVRSLKSSSLPAGDWSGTDGVAHKMAQHNSWTDTSWFFPALSSLSQAANSAFVFNYVAQQQLGSQTVQHIRSHRLLSGLDSEGQAEITRFSTVDYYLDSQTLLPVALAFNDHPDNDESSDVPVQIWFSNYRQVGGIQAPFHIQKYVSGGLALDISVQSVSVNSGLSSQSFTIQ